MSLLSFNPLHYAERLEKTGVTREQAKVQADAITQILDEKVATKQDLEKLATKEDLLKISAASKEDLLKAIAVSKEDLTKFATKEEMRWLFSITVTILILVMTIFKFFH
jgi:hypothetical protein